MQRTDPRVGIRRYRHGWQAYVRVDGRLVSRTFPRTTTREEMQAWRRSQRPEPSAPSSSTVPVHELSDPQKMAIVTIVQEAIRDQATGKGPVLQGVRARLFAGEERTS